MTKNIYRKCISWKAKIRRKNIVLETECIYTCEYLPIICKLEKLDISERRILPKIMGAGQSAKNF